MKNLQNIKNIVSKYSPEYDENDWNELQKKLSNKNSFPIKKTIIIFSSIVAIITILLLSIILFNHNQENNTIFNNFNLENKNVKIENKEDITIMHEEEDKEENNKTSNNFNNKNDISFDKNTKINIEENNIKELVTNNTVNYNIEEETKKKSEINNKPPELVKLDIDQYQDQDNKKDDNENNFLNNIKFDIEQVTNCVPAKIIFVASNIPANCDLLWDFGNNERGKGNSIEYIYTKAEKYLPTVSIVSNNFVLHRESLPEIQIYKATSFTINVDNDNLDYQFSVIPDNYSSIEWIINNESFNSKDLVYSFNNEGDYPLTVNFIDNNGCLSSLKKTITVKNEQIFYLPTAFTPNSTDINSSFGLIGENLKFNSYIFKIVDKESKVIFFSQNQNDKWNGKINNTSVDAPADIYLWELKAVDTNNKIIIKKGKVNLIR